MTAAPQKYRWLTIGQTYLYGPKEGKGDDTRRGSICTLQVTPRPGAVGNVLVMFGDSHTAIVPAGTLRKVKA